MDLITFSSPADFLQLVQPDLEQAESANNLMLGLALRLITVPERYETPFLGVVTGDQGLVVAGLMTPPHNLVVFNPRGEGEMAFAVLAQGLHQKSWRLRGVLGPSQSALTFAQIWQSVAGVTFRPGMRERVYELRQVIPPQAVPGRMRLATLDELDLVTQWLLEFWAEAVPGEIYTAEEALRLADFKIRQGDFFLWEDGQPVALAGRNRPTPHGYCVGPVYTPREYRGRGYASALTAELSQRLLDGGCQFTALFTDLNNPISNSIYQKIGYRPVCDFNEYLFGERV